MSTYYVTFKGTALATSGRVQSGSDNTDQTDWPPTSQFIYCVSIGQDGRNPVAAVLKLQWKRSEGSFADLGATGELKYTTGTNLSNGNAVTSGEALVAVSNMTWQDGEEIEDGVSASIDLGSDYYSELQFGIDPADAVWGATYEFQLYNNTLGAAVSGDPALPGTMLKITMRNQTINLPNTIAFSEVNTVQIQAEAVSNLNVAMVYT